MSHDGEQVDRGPSADGAEPLATPPTAHREYSAETSARPSAASSPQDIPAHSATDDPGMKPKVRASRACSSCNKQKLRCDGSHPCTRCIHHNKRDECEYLPSMRGKTRKRKSRPDDTVEVPSKPNRDSSPPRIAPRQVDGPSSSRPYPPILGSQMAYWKRDTLLSRHHPLTRILVDDSYRSPSQDIRDLDDIEGPTLPPISSVLRDPPRRRPSRSSLDDDPRGAPRTPRVSQTTLDLLAEASVEAVDDVHVGSLSTSTRHRPSRQSDPPEAEGVLRDNLPSILSIITTHEAEDLFVLFFKAFHPHCPFLDPDRCQPQIVARRSHDLFNAICLVSARSADAGLWQRLEGFAERALERLPTSKNIETVQALLIYALWDPSPLQSSGKDLTGLRVGLAVRLSIDIGLPELVHSHHVRTTLPGWAVRSIERTWRLTFAIDKIKSVETGTPTAANLPLLAMEDPAHEKTRTAPDIFVSALSDWAQILARVCADFRYELGDLSRRVTDSGFEYFTLFDTVEQYDKCFRLWRTDYEHRLTSFDRGTKQVERILVTIELYDRYAQLIVASFALQRALEAIPSEVPYTLRRLRRLAIRLIHVYEVEYETSTTHGTFGAPDHVYDILAYATISLLKTMDPAISGDDGTETAEIRIFIQRGSEMLRHAGQSARRLPAVQGEYLGRLVHAENIDWSTLGRRDVSLDLSVVAEMLDIDPSASLWPPLRSTRKAGLQISGTGGDSSYKKLVDFDEMALQLAGSSLVFGNFGRCARGSLDLSVV